MLLKQCLSQLLFHAVLCPVLQQGQRYNTFAHPRFSESFRFDVQVHTMMEESATACVSGDFAQALEKAKEAVSQASLSVVQ